MGRDYPNDSIAENSQNPEMSPGDLRRLAVTQTPMKNNQLTLMSKTLKVRNVQEISVRPYKQMVYAQTGACPRKWLA